MEITRMLESLFLFYYFVSVEYKERGKNLLIPLFLYSQPPQSGSFPRAEPLLDGISRVEE